MIDKSIYGVSKNNNILIKCGSCAESFKFLKCLKSRFTRKKNTVFYARPFFHHTGGSSHKLTNGCNVKESTGMLIAREVLCSYSPRCDHRERNTLLENFKEIDIINEGHSEVQFLSTSLNN